MVLWGFNMAIENDDMGGPFNAHQIRLWRHLDGVEDPYESIARHCNLLLKELMKDAPRLYGREEDFTGALPQNWDSVNFDYNRCTHTACLAPWTIRELKEEKE